MPLFLRALVLVLQVVGDERSKGWVRRGEVVASKCRFAARLHRRQRDIGPRVANGKQHRVVLESTVSDIPERRIVVEHVKAAPERGGNEIVFSPLELDVTKRDRGHATRELDPMRAAIRREVQPEFRAHEDPAETGQPFL